MRRVTVGELNRMLRTGRVVTLPASTWAALARDFEEIERHQTFIAGDLLIVRGEAGLVAVEESSPDERVMRSLPDGEAVRKFVQRRREGYERMWDGCGCHIDYYA